MSKSLDYSNVPIDACVLTGGGVEFRDNGADTKTVGMRLTARSGKAIDHPYWGMIIHDFAGMRTKNRIPIDYIHDGNEILGYVNKFDTSTGDLVLSGALTPFGVDDRASEVIHKMRAGVPYEASIYFTDGVLELVKPDETVEVNGNKLTGPLTVVREWTLRGVAICPHGADINTKSGLLSSTTGGFTVMENQDLANTDVAADDVSVDKLATVPAPETIENVTENAEGTVDPAALSAVEGEVTVDAEQKPEAELAAEPITPEPTPAPEISTAKLAEELEAAYGADVALAVIKANGDHAMALELAYNKVKAELADVKSRLAESTGGTPVQFSAGAETKNGWKSAQRKQ